jgi:hypothetical protein
MSATRLKGRLEPLFRVPPHRQSDSASCVAELRGYALRQRRTNVWREATSPARGAKLLRKRTRQQSTTNATMTASLTSAPARHLGPPAILQWPLA